MKLKTHKATAKKIKITRGKHHKKFMTKRAGQDHFNARESGNTTRGKRKPQELAQVNRRTAERMMPYA